MLCGFEYLPRHRSVVQLPPFRIGYAGLVDPVHLILAGERIDGIDGPAPCSCSANNQLTVGSHKVFEASEQLATWVTLTLYAYLNAVYCDDNSYINANE